jgi:hypothetical protein
MSDGLDVIVLDDDPGICEIVSELIESFYTWGNVYDFSDPDKAISFCLERDIGVKGISASRSLWLMYFSVA